MIVITWTEVSKSKMYNLEWRASWHKVILGWGLLKLCSLISPLQEILIWQKCKLDAFNHIDICLVSPQVSCSDTCQISTWCHTGNQCFDHWEKIGKITEWRYWLSDPISGANRGKVCLRPVNHDRMTWKCFPHYWLIMWRIHQLPVDSPHSHDMEMLSMLLAHYVGNTPVTSGFPSQSWHGNIFSTLLAHYVGNTPVTSGFPPQRTSNVDIWCFLRS